MKGSGPGESGSSGTPPRAWGAPGDLRGPPIPSPPRTQEAELPGPGPRPEAHPHSQKTLTSAAASVWPKGLRMRQVYRAWSPRAGRVMSSWSPSVRIRGGSAPSGSVASRVRPSRLQLSSPRPGLHPRQCSRSSAAPSSVSGVSGCTDSWGSCSGRGRLVQDPVQGPLLLYSQDSRPQPSLLLPPRTSGPSPRSLPPHRPISLSPPLSPLRDSGF